MIAIYPGSFDPITNGHIDIINRSAKKFDKVVVAILNNKDKNYLFSSQERLDILNEIFVSHVNIEIDSFDGLLVDYAKYIGADVVIRGLRAMTDFEYEMQMSMFNKKLMPELETMFLVTGDEFSFLSSSLVKEVASYGGDIQSFVPKVVVNRLKDKF